jgi:hypothetical protein
MAVSAFVEHDFALLTRGHQGVPTLEDRLIVLCPTVLFPKLILFSVCRSFKLSDW